MHDLHDLVTPEAVASGVTVGSKKKLFALLADVAARAYGLDAATVATALAARERLGTTGFGGGIAIPHGRIEGLENVRGVMLRLDKPIDFAAVDDGPVDLVFMLLSPVNAGAEHLKALARVSRTLRSEAVCAKLRSTFDPSALYAILTDGKAEQAA